MVQDKVLASFYLWIVEQEHRWLSRLCCTLITSAFIATQLCRKSKDDEIEFYLMIDFTYSRFFTSYYLASNPSATASAKFSSGTSAVKSAWQISLRCSYVLLRIVRRRRSRSTASYVQPGLTAPQKATAPSYWSWTFCNGQLTKQSRIVQHCLSAKSLHYFVWIKINQVSSQEIYPITFSFRASSKL